jgi:hypothetical protein
VLATRSRFLSVCDFSTLSRQPAFDSLHARRPQGAVKIGQRLSQILLAIGGRLEMHSAKFTLNAGAM